MAEIPTGEEILREVVEEHPQQYWQDTFEDAQMLQQRFEFSLYEAFMLSMLRDLLAELHLLGVDNE
jgi:hypothetical protein